MHWQRTHDETGTAASVRRRRRLAAALGATSLFGLVACGGPSTEDDADTAGTAPESALAVGDAVEVSDWEVTVTAVELDATESLTAATGVIATEPDLGYQYAKVVYEGTYRGDDSENSFYSQLNVVFWIDGVEYDDCGSNTPPELYVGGSVEKGETVTSAFCAQIPVDRTGEVLVNITDWRPVQQSGFFFSTG